VSEGIESYVHYSEYDTGKRHPIVVIQGDFGSRGYEVDTMTGELTQVCICAAHNKFECVCGYE